MNTRIRRPHARQRGFTLMEIMVVIAIIGLIATFVGPGIMNRMAEAEVTSTKVKMQNLKGAISNYMRHFKKVPDSLDDLTQPSEKNFNEPYVESISDISDSWDQPFVYVRKDSRNYELISYGVDGMEGGEGVDADISSLDGSFQQQ
ncbi:MAG: type II secretion system protein GspG [Planctomycetota bacterium]|nr:MAG: type II secretion system protein GspG [Planctomycetota bacterium]